MCDVTGWVEHLKSVDSKGRRLRDVLIHQLWFKFVNPTNSKHPPGSLRWYQSHHMRECGNIQRQSYHTSSVLRDRVSLKNRAPVALRLNRHRLIERVTLNLETLQPLSPRITTVLKIGDES